MFVGIFVLNKCLVRLLNQDYEFRSYFRFFELAKAGIATDISVYFFSIINVDLDRDIVHGTYYDAEQEIWKQAEFPFPDVLYDRRGGGSQRSKEKAREIRRKFQEHHIPKLNSKTHFDKWDLFDRLKDIPFARKTLPITKLNTTEKYLLKFLKKHQSIFLKALRGSRGLQVLRLEKKSNGKYGYSYFHHEQPIIGEVDEETELLKIVKSFFKSPEFIMQREIDVIHYNGCRVDFRAELQRNGDGQLEATAISARVAMEQSPISTHSIAYPHDVFFLQFLKYSEEDFIKLNNRIYNFLLNMYLTLEDTYGPFGEIGIDFALDQRGKLWLIEANAKSAKVSLYKAYDQETLERAFRNPLEYARYIYSMKGDESVAKGKVHYQYREIASLN